MANARAGRTSGLAILALASSLVACLPLGVVLGVWALVRIGRSEGRLEGRGLALGAIFLGGVLNAGGWWFMSVVYPTIMANSECLTQQVLLGRELSRLHSAELQFKSTKKRYGTLAEIGFTPTSPADPYEYTVLKSDEQGYLAQAKGRGPALNDDTWQVDQTGVPKNIHFGCGEAPPEPR